MLQHARGETDIVGIDRERIFEQETLEQFLRIVLPHPGGTQGRIIGRALGESLLLDISVQPAGRLFEFGLRRSVFLFFKKSDPFVVMETDVFRSRSAPDSGHRQREQQSRQRQ